MLLIENVKSVVSTVWLYGGTVYEGCSCAITSDLDRIAGGRHWLGIDRSRHGHKTFALTPAGYGNAHAWILTTETDVIIGYETVDGAYGVSDTAVAKTLESYIGSRLAYAPIRKLPDSLDDREDWRRRICKGIMQESGANVYLEPEQNGFSLTVNGIRIGTLYCNRNGSPYELVMDSEAWRCLPWGVRRALRAYLLSLGVRVPACLGEDAEREFPETVCAKPVNLLHGMTRSTPPRSRSAGMTMCM